MTGDRTPRPGKRAGASSAARTALHERLLRDESGTPTEAELLGMLLACGMSQRSAKELADQLLLNFGNLQGVLNASAAELCQCQGVGQRQCILIRVVRAIVERCSAPPAIPGDLLDNPRELERYLLARLSPMKEEVLLLIFLNRQGEVLGQEVLGAGTVDQVVMFPRQVMERALRFNASSLVLIHNHPHGPPLPSVRDREEAERLRELLRPFDITVVDAIVVGRNRCFSIFSNAPL